MYKLGEEIDKIDFYKNNKQNYKDILNSNIKIKFKICYK